MGAGETRVARGEPNHPIRELQQLENFFRVPGQQLELVRRSLRSGVAHELDLVEFVHSQQPASVFPCCARFAPETGGVGSETFG